MTQAQARREVFGEWDKWNGDKAEPGAAFVFWMELQQRRPEIRFRTKADLWQHVSGWLRNRHVYEESSE